MESAPPARQTRKRRATATQGVFNYVSRLFIAPIFISSVYKYAFYNI
jgi:hypothetical protein